MNHTLSALVEAVCKLCAALCILGIAGFSVHCLIIGSITATTDNRFSLKSISDGAQCPCSSDVNPVPSITSAADPLGKL